MNDEDGLLLDVSSLPDSIALLVLCLLSRDGWFIPNHVPSSVLLRLRLRVII